MTFLTNRHLQSSYTKAYSVIHDFGSVPRRAIFSPRETTNPECICRTMRVQTLGLGGGHRSISSWWYLIESIIIIRGTMSCLLGADRHLSTGRCGWNREDMK